MYMQNKNDIYTIFYGSNTAELLINNQVVINPDSKIFGRSVYLCYNKLCIENALKKDKISKVLKHNVSEELKGKLVKIE